MDWRQNIPHQTNWGAVWLATYIAALFTQDIQNLVFIVIASIAIFSDYDNYKMTLA